MQCDNYIKLSEFNINRIKTFPTFGKIKGYFIIFFYLIDETCYVDEVFFV